MPPQRSSTVWPAGLAVDVDEDGIPFRGVEVGRLEHVAVDLHTVPGVHLEVLDRRLEQRGDLLLQCGVVVDQGDPLVLGQRDELADARVVESRVPVSRESSVRRDRVGVRAGELRRRDADGIALTVERGAVQIALRGILRRRHDIHRSTPFVDAGHGDRVERSARHQRFASFARDAVDVHPAVLLAGHEEALAAGERACLRQPAEADRDERVVVVAPHLAHRSARGLREQVASRVLQAVQLLDEQRARVRPLQPGDVVFPRLARQLHPPDGAALRLDDADAHRGVRRAGERIRHAHDGRVGARLRIRQLRDDVALLAQVIGEREVAHAAQVELPEGDTRAVRAPAEAVVQIELFLVHPVGPAVAHQIGTVPRQARDRSARQVLDVEIVLPHVGDLRRAGIELRVQQAGFRHIAAKLLEAARLPVEQPVVAARVGAPDTAGVGEDQDPLSVRRPRQVLDLERRSRTRRRQLRGGDQHLALGRRGAVVLDDLHLAVAVRLRVRGARTRRRRRATWAVRRAAPRTRAS